jgi:hypothetical protein
LFSGEDKKPAKVIKITCIHCFESSPQTKIGMAYNLQKASGEVIYVVIIYSVQ